MSEVASSLQAKGAGSKSRASSRGKQVKLRLKYIDLWSALKLSAVLGLVAGVVTIVVGLITWVILDVLGVFARLDGIMQDLLSMPDFTLMDFASLPRVLLFSAIIALLNFIVITVLGGLAALIYNRSVDMTGGLVVGFTNN